jgi:hypothetical protein
MRGIDIWLKSSSIFRKILHLSANGYKFSESSPSTKSAQRKSAQLWFFIIGAL